MRVFVCVKASVDKRYIDNWIYVCAKKEYNHLVAVASQVEGFLAQTKLGN